MMDLIKVLKPLEVKNCCRCITLRTGIKFIGFLSLIESIVICLYLISTYTVYAMGAEEMLGDRQVPYVLYYMMFHLIDLVTSFLLLLGVYQRKPEMMSWWLGFTLISVVLECVFPSIFIRGLRSMGLHSPYYMLTPLSLLYNVYVLLVVYSYYRTIIRRREVELSAPPAQLSQVLETHNKL